MSTGDKYPRPESTPFVRTAGDGIKAKEALERTAAYRKDEESRGHKRGEYTESEFFGAETIQELLRQHPGSVGIRFYYGINVNDPDGPNARRLTLVAVDAAGKDIFKGGDLRGLKDPGDGEAVGDGINCPRHCPQ